MTTRQVSGLNLSVSIQKYMNEKLEILYQELRRRIVVLDGAMGSMIQEFQLTESDFRGTRFRDFPFDINGNLDVLSLTRPDIITTIHERYLEAGADIIETNTFSANRISQGDYHFEEFVYEMNLAAAKLARDAADRFTLADPSRPRFVAGSIGPTNKTASMSPDVNNPGFRSVTF